MTKSKTHLNISFLDSGNRREYFVYYTQGTAAVSSSLYSPFILPLLEKHPFGFSLK